MKNNFTLLNHQILGYLYINRNKFYYLKLIIFPTI